MSAGFHCPRRHDLLAYAGHSPIFDPEHPGTDSWRDNYDPYHVSPTCSYCGSCSPAALFAAIDAGYELGPTDKGYKLYLELPNENPQALRVNGGCSGGDQSKPPDWGTASGGYWKRRQKLNRSERKLAIDCGMHRKGDEREGWLLFGPAGPTKHGKFYFQHFSAADRERFLELLNDGKINFGYPGHLYVTPYFAREASDGA